MRYVGKQGSWYVDAVDGRNRERLPTLLDYWRNKGMHFVDRGDAGDATSQRAQDYAAAVRRIGKVVLCKGELRVGVLVRVPNGYVAQFRVDTASVEFRDGALHLDLVERIPDTDYRR